MDIATESIDDGDMFEKRSHWKLMDAISSPCHGDEKYDASGEYVKLCPSPSSSPPAAVAASPAASAASGVSVLKERPWALDQDRVCGEDQIIDNSMRGVVVWERHDLYRNWSSVLQCIVLGPILVPLRFVLIALATGVLFTLFVALDWLMYCGSVVPYSQMALWRRRLFRIAYNVVARLDMVLFGFWCRRRHYISEQEVHDLRMRYTDGYDNILRRTDRPPFVIVSNHVSDIDTGILACEFGVFSTIAKSPVRHIPLIRSWCKKMEYLFFGGEVNEGVALVQIIRDRIARYKLSNAQNFRELPRLMVYSEGTVTNGRWLLHFHRGAFVAGEPVQPVLLRYPYRKLNPTVCGRVNTILWWIALTSQIYNSVDIIHFPPYIPTEAERRDPALYARNVRTVMCFGCNRVAGALNRPELRLRLAREYFKRKIDPAHMT